MRAITTDSSAPATARNPTPPVAFARGPRPPMCRCRPISSFPTPKSRSADASGLPWESGLHALCLTSSGSHHERTIRLQAEQSSLAMDRAAPADLWPHAFIVRGLSDAAQPELLVDLRRHPVLHARHADPDRRHPRDALHAERGSRLPLGR